MVYIILLSKFCKITLYFYRKIL